MHTKEAILDATNKDAILMIRENMLESDKWLIRGLLAIFRYQTNHEQASEVTEDHNSVGFSGVDGQILSSFAKQVLRWEKGERKYPTPLSSRQLEILRKKMGKYAGQLVRIIHAKQPACVG